MQALASSLEAHPDDKAKPIEAASLRAAVQSPHKLPSSVIKADASPTLSHTSPAKAVSKPVTQPAPSPTAVRLPSSQNLYSRHSLLHHTYCMVYDLSCNVVYLFVSRRLGLARPHLMRPQLWLHQGVLRSGYGSRCVACIVASHSLFCNIGFTFSQRTVLITACQWNLRKQWPALPRKLPLSQ